MVYWLLLAEHTPQRTIVAEASVVAADGELGHAASLHQSILDWKALFPASVPGHFHNRIRPHSVIRPLQLRRSRNPFFSLFCVELQGKRYNKIRDSFQIATEPALSAGLPRKLTLSCFFVHRLPDVHGEVFFINTNKPLATTHPTHTLFPNTRLIYVDGIGEKQPE